MQQQGTVKILHEKGCQSLRVTHSYKHLGSYLQADVTPRREVQHRISTARKAWGPLCRTLWKRDEVSLQSKLKLFRSLVMSRLGYHGHVMALMGPKECAQLQEAFRTMLMPLVQPLVQGMPAFDFDVDVLAGVIGVHTPESMIRVQRLRYFERAVRHMPQVIWQLVEACQVENSWYQHLMDDLQWLCTQHPNYDWPAAGIDLEGWCLFVLQCRDWTTLISKAAKDWLRFQTRNAKHQIWERELHRRVAGHGVLIQPSVEDASSGYRCDLCDELFATKRGLYMHSSCRHGYKPLPKFFAFGSHCLGCGTEYHARPRLVAHLRTAYHCLAKLRACFPPMTEEEIGQKELEDVDFCRKQKALGLHVRKAILPACKVPSALLPEVGSEDAISNACSKN